MNEYGIDGNGRWFLKPLPQPWHRSHRNAYRLVGGIDEVIHPGTLVDVAFLDPSDDLREFPARPPECNAPGFFLLRYHLYSEDCEATEGSICLDSAVFYAKCAELNERGLQHLVLYSG